MLTYYYYYGRDYCHSSRGGYGGFQHPTFQILWPLTFHSQPFGSSHIPYPNDLDQNIPNPTKIVQFVHLFVLYHDISHGVVISTIFAGRIEFSSDGKGIDSFFVMIIYMFQEPINIFWITSAPMCLAREWGGGAYYVASHQPEPITIRHHPSGNNNCYQ